MQRRGETAPGVVRDEARLARHDQTNRSSESLLERALERANMVAAWKRVKANGGSAGVDGRTVQQTGNDLATEWMRHRLRAAQLKQWRRGSTAYQRLRALGASEDTARYVAGNVRCWWHNSALALNRVLTIAYFDRLGVPRLC